MMSKLSLGDARAYYLSTAKNELGVVSAQSIAGMKGCNIQFVCTNTWNCSHRCNSFINLASHVFLQVVHWFQSVGLRCNVT